MRHGQKDMTTHAVLTTPADRTGAWSVSSLSARPSGAGRHPRLHFRGLLKRHSRYSLHGCLAAQRRLCPEASTRPVTRPSCSVAITSHRQIHEWILLPLAPEVRCVKVQHEAAGVASDEEDDEEDELRSVQGLTGGGTREYSVAAGCLLP